jgi:hypothetical protein
MQSKATTVDQYLAELPPDRKAAIAAVRKAILAALPAGYEEGMQYGMIGYYVPHSIYPTGYHCDPNQPAGFVCLASQKNYMSLYMGCVYGESELARWFQAAWAKTGKKLDMGKSCIRFKRVEDLALDVIGEAIRRMPVEACIAMHEAARNRTPMKRDEIAARTKAKKAANAAAGKGAEQAKQAAKEVAAKKARGPREVKKSRSAGR